MLKAFQQLFSTLTPSQESELKPDEPLAIAALLIEVATSDGEVADEERKALAHLLEKEFACAPEEVESLMSKAQSSHDSAICLYRYTSIVKQAPMETRQKVIAALWRVAYADGQLDPYEEASIRKVADLLYVSHSDFVKAKLSACS